MDERRIAKDALKREYLKEITCQLIKEGKLSDDAITVDEKGEIQFWGAIRQNPDYVFGLVRFLAVELANTKAELWLQSQSTNDKKNLQSALEDQT
jgi:hypothetical protein